MARVNRIPLVFSKSCTLLPALNIIVPPSNTTWTIQCIWAINPCLEARIAELEGQPKPPTAAGKARKPASWVKANRPARSKGERRERPTDLAGDGRSPPSGGHATVQLPRLPGSSDRREDGEKPPVITMPRVRVLVTVDVVLEQPSRLIACLQRCNPELEWAS